MRMKFSRMNFETECMNDLITGKGFLISEMPFSDVDKSIKNVYGPRSSLYGTTFNDQNEFQDRYSCQCSKCIGAVFEGEVCPHCNTKIEYRDVDMLFTGWINMSPYKLINPMIYGSLL